MKLHRRVLGGLLAGHALVLVACVQLTELPDDRGADASVDGSTDARLPTRDTGVETTLPPPDASRTTATCGTNMCESVSNAAFTYLACCPARAPTKCGLQIPTIGTCAEPKQPGVETTQCSVFLLPQAAADPDCQGLDAKTAAAAAVASPAKRKCFLPGCCKPQGICGFLDMTSAGVPLTLPGYGCVYTDEFGVASTGETCTTGDAGDGGDAGDAGDADSGD